MPGSIGLWEKDTRLLFAGDAVHDGPLVDVMPESDVAGYVRTMRRLRDIPADVVHAGHDPSFGRTGSWHWLMDTWTAEPDDRRAGGFSGLR